MKLYEIAGAKNLIPIVSRPYPEKKWIKERKHQIEQPELNRLKEKSVPAWNTIERRLDIPRSGRKDNAA
jgi:hypothetical protein